MLNLPEGEFVSIEILNTELFHEFKEDKKCITINIVDFKCIPLKKLHSTYNIVEDSIWYILTYVLEVHFLEIPKLFDDEVPKDEESPIVQWMEFLDGKSKGVIEMLAKKSI